MLKNLQNCFETLYEQANHRIETGDLVSVISASCLSPEFNMIFGAPSKTSLESYQDNLLGAFQQITPLNTPFSFIQNHDSDPEITELLAESGFSYIGRATCVSINHSDCLDVIKQGKATFKLIRVMDEELFGAWCQIVDESFSMIKGASQSVFGPATAYLFSEDSFHHLYLLQNERGVPVSAALLHLPDDESFESGFYCCGTINEYRNKGAMSDMVAKLVEIAISAGFKSSVAQCYDSSLRLAERFGCRPQGELDIFSNAASKAIG